MKFNQIIKKIKSDTWWTEAAPMNYQYAWAAWRAFTLQAHTFGRGRLSICVMTCENSFGGERTSEQEKLSQFWLVFREFRRTRQIKDYKNFKIACKRMLAIGRKVEKYLHSGSKDNFTLRRLYKDFYDAYEETVTHATMPEAADIYTDQWLLGDLRKELGQNYASDALTKIALTLSCQPTLSFIERERRDFLTQCLAKKPDFKQVSKKHHWVQNNYLTPRFLSAEHFAKQAVLLKKQKTRRKIMAELRSLETKPEKLRKQQKLLQRRLRFSSKMKAVFAYLRYTGRWIDERKDHMMHAVYFVDILLKEIFRRAGISKTDLGYYTPEEIDLLLSENQIVPKRVLKAREKMSVYVTWPEKNGYGEALYIGTRAREIYELFESSKHKELRGIVASAPVKSFSGTAQIILNPHKEKFTPGRILITTMTRPDFVPIMRQASAVITDEGGITSHAAIISRELRIPCIIGTKNATRTLKTGQKVILDLVMGKVLT